MQSYSSSPRRRYTLLSILLAFLSLGVLACDPDSPAAAPASPQPDAPATPPAPTPTPGLPPSFEEKLEALINAIVGDGQTPEERCVGEVDSDAERFVFRSGQFETPVTLNRNALPAALQSHHICTIQAVVHKAVEDALFEVAELDIDANSDAVLTNCVSMELNGFVFELGCNKGDNTFVPGRKFFALAGGSCNQLAFEYSTKDKTRSSRSMQDLVDHMLMGYRFIGDRAELGVFYEDVAPGHNWRKNETPSFGDNWETASCQSHTGDYNDMGLTLSLPKTVQLWVRNTAINTCGVLQPQEIKDPCSITPELSAGVLPLPHEAQEQFSLEVAGLGLKQYRYAILPAQGQACDEATFSAWRNLDQDIEVLSKAGGHYRLCLEGKGTDGSIVKKKLAWIHGTKGQGIEGAKYGELLKSQLITAEINPDDLVNLVVLFAGEPNLSAKDSFTSRNEKRWYVYNQYKALAEQTHGDALNEATQLQSAQLIENYHDLILGQAILARVKNTNLEQVAAAFANADNVKLIEVEAPTQEIAVEANITNLGAEDIWNKYRYRGKGVTVGIMEPNGVDIHAAIDNQWRRNALGNAVGTDWYDAAGISPLAPISTSTTSHGTHVTGIVVGEDGLDQIGVAPESTWIAARWNDGGSDMLAAEWMGAPFQVDASNNKISASDPTKAPDIINNSWIKGETVLSFRYGLSTSTVEPMFRAWRAMDILPVCGAGNNGLLPALPFANVGARIGSPANYPESFSVISVVDSIERNTFSSYGPMLSHAGLAITDKPEIGSFGNAIRSSSFGSGYTTLSGTSMATPHVTGCGALLLSANPNLTPDQLEALMIDSAIDMEDPGHDFFTGHGMLDCGAAMEELVVDIDDLTISCTPAPTLSRTTCQVQVPKHPFGFDHALPPNLAIWIGDGNTTQTLDKVKCSVSGASPGGSNTYTCEEVPTGSVPSAVPGTADIKISGAYGSLASVTTDQLAEVTSGAACGAANQACCTTGNACNAGLVCDPSATCRACPAGTTLSGNNCVAPEMCSCDPSQGTLNGAGQCQRPGGSHTDYSCPHGLPAVGNQCRADANHPLPVSQPCAFPGWPATGAYCQDVILSGAGFNMTIVGPSPACVAPAGFRGPGSWQLASVNGRVVCGWISYQLINPGGAPGSATRLALREYYAGQSYNAVIPAQQSTVTGPPVITQPTCSCPAVAPIDQGSFCSVY